MTTKCSTESCNNDSHELLTVEGKETLTEHTVCPECFENITEECADCITDPMDGDPDRNCNDCEQAKAEILIGDR